ADREGNVWIGRDRELATMAHAAAKTVVTVEQLYEGNLFDDPSLAAGALGGFYVQAIAGAPKGAWPLGLADHYGRGAAHLADYAGMAASSNGFAAYLDRHVHAQRAARVLYELVMRGQKRVEDARERAYDPRIHLLTKIDGLPGQARQ